MTRGIGRLTRPITVRVYIALLLTGLVVTASYLFLARSLQEERALFRIVDMAKEQCEAVEAAANLANLIAAEDGKRQGRDEELSRALKKIKQRNDILSLRDPGEWIPAKMRGILQHMYFSAAYGLDNQMANYLQNTAGVLNAGGGELDNNPNVKAISETTAEIVGTHNEMIRLLRKEAIMGIERIRLEALVLWLITISLLIIELPLIFRPMVRKAAGTFRKMQYARRKAERDAALAEAARNAQAGFIRTITHELRTPLNAILGMAQLLRMRDLPPKEDEYVRDIHEAGGHLFELINSVLEFSRLEAGYITIECRPIFLEQVMENAISIMRPLAVGKSLELTCDCDPRLSDKYLADRARIRQILLNLIGNAIKFTPNGSVIVRTIHAGEAGSGSDRVRFEVEDTGIGVDPKRHKLIFQEFQQADNSLARRYGGTGLGLAISQRLVDLMNGEIGVKSKVGEGSLFWFTLNLERACQSSSRSCRSKSAAKCPSRLRQP